MSSEPLELGRQYCLGTVEVSHQEGQEVIEEH
jgi:hypothetical protein